MAEEKDRSQTIETGGGSMVGRDVSLKGGQFIGRDLIQHIHYHMTPPRPATLPDMAGDQSARIFIGYKRHTPSMADQRLAVFLQQTLEASHHQVFIDLTLRTGEDWLKEIDRNIRQADFFIALLSSDSVQSEMLQSEIYRAYQHRQQTGRPFILPVRMNLNGMLPYAIDAFLNPFQYVTWQSEEDQAAVAQEILAAIQGELANKRAISPTPEEAEENAAHPALVERPSPSFDPRILKRLRAPGGAVRMSDTLYVERPEDGRLREALTDWGETITIRAPRQTGKTSLLVRAVNHAENEGLQTVFLDFQAIGGRQLANKGSFLRILADKIAYEMGIAAAEVDQYWDRPLADQDKLTQFMQDVVLSQLETPLVLAIDEADELLKTDYYQDIFGLVRSWHNRRARHEEWELLNLVLVISTEPYLLIDDVSQSPFNVGLRIELHDFTNNQVQWLNEAHGAPLTDDQIREAVDMLGGQPYLWRKCFFEIVKEKKSWMEIQRTAANDDGPFGDHLRRQLWGVQDHPELLQAMREVIRLGRCDDDRALYRLMRAGLIIGSGHAYRCRCQLYRQYFQAKLT
ncbi:MAG: AAA-like domain-containing protein [Ardenticatenaceae bacterium]|nr:AAA-like domain-containing protein [Ardenticatenaceae bacterium]